MTKKQNVRFWQKRAISAVVLLVVALAYQQGVLAFATRASRPASAATQVAQAWDNVRNSDQYNFAADIVIKTIPLPTAGNIGRFSKIDSLYLEGTNDLHDKDRPCLCRQIGPPLAATIGPQRSTPARRIHPNPGPLEIH